VAMQKHAYAYIFGTSSNVSDCPTLWYVFIYCIPWKYIQDYNKLITYHWNVG